MIGYVAPPELHVMTYNLRRPFPRLRASHPDRWANRHEAARRLLSLERPSLLAVQEVLPAQIDVVHEALGEGYERLGYGRSASGGGERVLLFVDTARLTIQSWEQLALSATPHVPGSRSWGEAYPRTAVIASLRDRVGGAEFLAIGTHLDPFSARSRLNAARMLAQLARGGRAIVLGDANANAGSAPHRELTAVLDDTWDAAEERVSEPWGTWANYRAPRAGGRRIDWILADPSIAVRRVGINAARFDGRAGSDHLAVQAVLRMPRS